jgi:hypothetical protein
MKRRQFVSGLVATAVLGAGGTASASQGPVLDISINKVSQKMTVRIDGKKKYVWPVSTGAAGYETPSGKFKPFRMEKEHFSKEWDDAPMPHSVFFTTRGHAIHGSYYVKSLGRRASHGCVRLAPENAATLFGLVQKSGMGNTTITLKGGFFDGGFGDGFEKFDDEVGSTVKKIRRKFKKRKGFWLGGVDNS